MSGRYGRAPGIARLVALWVLLLALLATSRPSPASLAAGAVLVAAGESLRAWAAGHLHKTVQLVTAGPYAYTRNPLYLGRLLILTGIGLAATLPGRANLAVLAAAWVLFFGYYLPRKERVEPARLGQLHGAAYDRYRAAVPALFPRLGAWPESGRTSWSATRFVRNREHWMVLGLLVAFGILALRVG
jgi:protein-S-isoprenylcysteine O-methyltransferase Ste14